MFQRYEIGNDDAVQKDNSTTTTALEGSAHE
jgi:hypothetical protein